MKKFISQQDGTLILPCNPQKIEVEEWFHDSPTILKPRSIAVIPYSEYAYVLANDGIYLCKINDANGQFTSCRDQDRIHTRGKLYGIAVDVNATVLYITSSEKLYSCKINPHNGSIEQPCHPNFSSIVHPFRGNIITLSNTNPPYLYYIRSGHGYHYNITSCLRDANNNIHSEECNDYQPVSTPLAIVADPHHHNVYFTTNKEVFSCMIEANGTLYDCKEAYDIKSLTPGISFDPILTTIAIAPDGEHIYIGSSQIKDLTFCTINYHNRTFDKCTVYHDIDYNAASLAYR